MNDQATKLDMQAQAPTLPVIAPEGFVTGKWPLDRILRLIELRNLNWSGRRIGAEMGVTRNIVLGKLNRMGLSCTSARPPRQRVMRLRPPRPKRPSRPKATLAGLNVYRRWIPPVQATRTAPQAPPEPLPETRVTIWDIGPHSCRWPLFAGDESADDKFYCGGVSLAGAPYCAHHCRQAYHASWVRA